MYDNNEVTEWEWGFVGGGLPTLHAESLGGGLRGREGEGAGTVGIIWGGGGGEGGEESSHILGKMKIKSNTERERTIASHLFERKWDGWKLGVS